MSLYAWLFEADYGEFDGIALPIQAAPCPFCGSSPILRSSFPPGVNGEAKASARGTYGIWVTCLGNNCFLQLGFAGPGSGSQRYDEGMFDSCLEAAEAWNKRIL